MSATYPRGKVPARAHGDITRLSTAVANAITILTLSLTEKPNRILRYPDKHRLKCKSESRNPDSSSENEAFNVPEIQAFFDTPVRFLTNLNLIFIGPFDSFSRSSQEIAKIHSIFI